MPRALAALRQIAVTNPMELIWPLLVFAITFGAGLLIRRLVRKALRTWTSRTQSRTGQILQEALRSPSFLWVLILSVHLAVVGSDLPDRVLAPTTSILAGLWIISITLMGTRLARDLVRFYGGQIPGALPVTTLTQNLAQIAVVILGLLVLLAQYRVAITPILTALGVGGLAVALALQDTLSNLFSGFYVAVAGQIRLGDYIKLNTNEEGYVTDIGWRSTIIRGLANNYVIVPNSKLAQAIVTNYHLPDKSMGTGVQVGVDYESDPEEVLRVLREIGLEAAGQVPGMLATPPPSAVFDPGFGDSSMNFTLNFQVAEFANQFGVRQELRKRIVKRFRQAGIRLSAPVRVVYLPERKQ
jgi:small-conductance mechanosensitive channel